MLISVIVPVYNAELWLERCAASILGQTHSELELIFVDDGSTDSSPAICDRLAERDSRVMVIHKANGGVSAARNDALAAARGEWIAFCDNDDFMAPAMLARLLAIALAADADIVQGGVVQGSAVSLASPPPAEVSVFSGREMLESFYSRASIFVWDKLYRRRVWQSVRFPVGSYTDEDQYVAHRLLGAARRVASTREPLYYHFIHPASVMNRGFDLRWATGAMDDRVEFALANDLPQLYRETVVRRLFKERYLITMNRRYTRSAAFEAEHRALLRRYYGESLSVGGISLRNRAFMFLCRYVPLLYHAYNYAKWRIFRPQVEVRFGEIK